MIPILKVGQVPNSEIFARVTPEADVAAIVADILADVKENGDTAVKAYCAKFDKAELTSLEVTPEEIQEAISQVEPEFLDILREAAENIRSFHSRQVRNSFVIADKPGIVLGQKITPIEKVGVYVPGGTAALPFHGAHGHHSRENCRLSPAGDGYAPRPGREGEPCHSGGSRPCRGESDFQGRRGARPLPPWPTARKAFPRWIRL